MEKSTAESRVRRYIEEWKQKLVDLTRRNRLIYFKRTKGSTLIITQPDVQTVFERLVIKEANWEFWFPPSEEKDTDEDSILDPSNPSEKGQESQSQSIFPEQEATFKEPIVEVYDLVPKKPSTSSKPIRINELVIEGLGREELEKVIKNLYRRSSSDYEERGVRISILH
ncbi:MAG: DUF4011 domain-containing protein [Deltaproteobacteria bacterium]|nr:DUF4011 domain-containing protein [Deltaproteobacteria bacterium]